MTSSDIAISAALLEQLTGSGREITELADTASFRNPEWYSGICVVGARKLLLGQIAGLIEVHGQPTADAGQVVLMAGPPGAGKSTVRPVVESDQNSELAPTPSAGSTRTRSKMNCWCQ